MPSHDALLLSAADALAAWLHRDDVDKQGEPLIGHCRRVRQTVWEQGAGIEAEVTALLHDTIEHGHVSYEALRELFGRVVAGSVLGVSRAPGESYSEYISGVIVASRGADSRFAKVVKLADLRDNLDESRGPIPDSLRQRYERAVARLEAAG